jgi:hypothetical protein
VGDPRTYPMTMESAGFARRDLNRFEGLIEPSLLDDMRIITSELVTLVTERSLADGSSSIVVTTSLASNVLRIEVDQIVTTRAASAHDEQGTGEAVIRGISDRCSDMERAPFQTWAEIDVRTNGLITRLQPPL